MSRILIDTNIYSSALKGNFDVAKLLQSATDIGICAISIGELLSGFAAGNRQQKNRDELNSFLDSPRVTILRVDEDTAEFYSSILISLRAKGTPIPTNDIWIAACAMQHGRKVLTFDRHFDSVPGLLIHRL